MTRPTLAQKLEYALRWQHDGKPAPDIVGYLRELRAMMRKVRIRANELERQTETLNRLRRQMLRRISDCQSYLDQLQQS